jgi:pyruvate kinase
VDEPSPHPCADLRDDAEPGVAAQDALYRNVVPLPLQSSADRDVALEQAEELLLSQGVVQRGDSSC